MSISIFSFFFSFFQFNNEEYAIFVLFLSFYQLVIDYFADLFQFFFNKRGLK